VILPLRRRHRVASVGLAVALPVLFAAALAVRRPVPAIARLPFAVVPPRLAGSSRVHDTGTGLALRLTFPVTAPGARAGRVALELLRDPRTPDLLAYWSPAAGSVGDSSLPDDARLLGAIVGRGPTVFELPEPAAGGHLVLYSLAHRTLVDTLELGPSGEPPP